MRGSSLLWCSAEWLVLGVVAHAVGEGLIVVKRSVCGVLSGVLAVGLGAGVAHADVIIADPPSTPAKITVKNPAEPYPLAQPPVEWTVYAQPYGLVPRGKAQSNYTISLHMGIPSEMSNLPPRGPYYQPARYSRFYKSARECNAVLDPYGHTYGPLNVVVLQHYVWMAKNDWTENVSNKCYQIFNGMWVHEYINFFESPGMKNLQKLPGRYPSRVPADQKKYLRK